VSRRVLLIVLAGWFAFAGAGAFAFYYFNKVTTLVLAVGPARGEDARLMAAVARQIGRERAMIRLRIVEKDGPAEAAAAIEQGEADLAVVRRDVVMPPTGQAIAILRKNVVAIIAAPGSNVQKVRDLAGKAVGVVGRGPANARVLQALLDYYQVPADSVRTVAVDPDDIASQVQGVQALMVARPVTSPTFAEAFAALSRPGRPAKLVTVSEAEALAQRGGAFDHTEIPAGALGGSPPLPAEKTDTLTLSELLVARKTLNENLAGEIARLLFAVRPMLQGEFPAASQIEAPPTEKDATVLAHPGAAAYYTGEQQTFFDRYGDWVYLMIFAGSGLGSAGALLASYMKSGDRKRRLALLDRLHRMVRDARTADDPKRLDELQCEADEILSTAIRQVARNKLDDAALTALSLALDQTRITIAERRVALERSEKAATQPVSA
jgi:TRAP transporter TAXI family solute receptor